MKAWLSKLETSYNLLSKNHKILVIAMAFLFVFIFWYSATGNLLASMGKNKKDILQASSEIAILKKQVMILKTKKIDNKNSGYQAEEIQLKKKLSDVTAKIESFRFQLVSPKKVFFNLKNMLDANQTVRLMSVKYLPEELVKDANSQPVFRSPIEITLQGTFPEIVAYLKKAEQANTFIFWDEADYKVMQYPMAILKLKIHVLTSDEGQKNAVAH